MTSWLFRAFSSTYAKKKNVFYLTKKLFIYFILPLYNILHSIIYFTSNATIINYGKILFSSLNFYKKFIFYSYTFKSLFSSLNFVKHSTLRPSGSMTARLCPMWLNGVLTWYLTWTKIFYLKSFGHVAQSYWHTFKKKSNELPQPSVILQPRNPTPKPPIAAATTRKPNTQTS